MVIDTSALIAILNNEPEAAVLAEALAESAVSRLSVVSWVETGIVIESRYGQRGAQLLHELVNIADILIEPVSLDQGIAARLAYRSFGKGRHSAGLNFGDCFAYGLAMVTNEPLLFKGDDFSQTDILQAMY